jgi:hypothetical protein
VTRANRDATNATLLGRERSVLEAPFNALR